MSGIKRIEGTFKRYNLAEKKGEILGDNGKLYHVQFPAIYPRTCAI